MWWELEGICLMWEVGYSAWGEEIGEGLFKVFLVHFSAFTLPSSLLITLSSIDANNNSCIIMITTITSSSYCTTTYVTTSPIILSKHYFSLLVRLFSVYAVVPIIVPFLGCVRLSGHVPRLLLFSFLFYVDSYFCWCEKNTGRHFISFYLEK